MVWKKKGILASSVLALTLSLVGCGSGEKASTSSASKDKTLTLLTWEGYADPAFTKEFEEKYGVKIQATYFGSSDELIAKLKAGGGDTYDIISPSSDVAQSIVQSGMAEAIDTSKISNWNNLNERLRNLKDVTKDEKVYGLPFTWGPDYLIYDADVVKKEPTSWNVFWDPQYKGKVSVWDDISNIYLAGQLAGLDKSDSSALYNMSEQQLQDAKKKLVDLKSQVRKYWATAGELNDLFANKEVVLAVGWPLTVKEVNAKGRNLKWTIPTEGATGWIDRLMIVKGAKHKDLAEKYLDYIAQPEQQAKVAEVTNYSVANPQAAQFMSKELQDMTFINNMDGLFSKLNFWQYVKDRSRYNEVWTEVKTN